MNFNEAININTNVTVTVKDIKSGKILQVIKEHNLAVTTGKDLLRDFLNGDAVTGLTYLAIGTDNTAAIAGNTTLGVEVFRKVYTTTTKTSATLNMMTYISSTEGNGNTIVEAGLFGNGATGSADSGTLYSRVIHTAIVKTTAIGITYDWDVTLTAS